LGQSFEPTHLYGANSTLFLVENDRQPHAVFWIFEGINLGEQCKQKRIDCRRNPQVTVPHPENDVNFPLAINQCPLVSNAAIAAMVCTISSPERSCAIISAVAPYAMKLAAIFPYGQRRSPE
jgi:hypothetical protein